MSEGGTIERVYLVKCTCGALAYRAGTKREAVRQFLQDGWTNAVRIHRDERWRCAECSRPMEIDRFD